MLTRNDSIRYFEGPDQNKAISKYCTFKNLRFVIQQKQKKVASVLGNRSETIVIIYPEDQATYKNFIDAMDEIQINDIKHYFVMNSNSNSKAIFRLLTVPSLPQAKNAFLSLQNGWEIF